MLAAALAACSSPPSAERQLEEAWTSSPQARLDAAIAPDAARQGEALVPAVAARPTGQGWTLDEILARIERGNPDLQVASARLDEARAAARAARAAFLPSLGLEVGYLATDEPAQAFGLLLNQERLSLGPGFDATPGTVENWRYQARVDWALLLPGRSEQHAAAKEAEQAAGKGREAARQQLGNAGVQVWLGLRAARELLEVAAQSVAVVQRRHALTQTRHAAGAALRTDVLRLQARVAEARQESAMARLQVQQAEAALLALMGLDIDQELPLAEGQEAVGVTLPASLEQALGRARTERADLRAAAHAARAHVLQAQASAGERWPSLVAFGAYDIDGRDPGIDTDLGSYAVGAFLSLGLSAGTSARIEAAEARALRARADLRRQVLAVMQEVRNAWDGLQVARETLELATVAATAAQAAFADLTAAQDAGAATTTDVLEAESAWRQARAREVTARYGVELAGVRLLGSMGGVR